MMMYRFFIFIFVCLFCYAYHSNASPKRTIQKVLLGQTPVFILVEDYGLGKKNFIHLHANEKTALKAARQIASVEGGKIITLIHQPTRDIHFSYQGKHYSFDPNRIFTSNGISLTLKKHDCDDDKAREIVAIFAQSIMKNIPEGKIVAVHNNREYSLLDYLPKHSLESDAKSLYYKKSSNHRNFFLVTRNNDFKRYKSLGYNVVYQNKQAQDDGSLSVVMSKRQYINVEAGHGQLSHQKQMLRLA